MIDAVSFYCSADDSSVFSFFVRVPFALVFLGYITSIAIRAHYLAASSVDGA